MEIAADRMRRFVYEPEDEIEVVSQPQAAIRAAVRLRLGEAAVGMSDADLDRVIAAATGSRIDMRTDVATGPVVKVGGKSANGKGYNPYRAAGKFASGPHKEKPKSGAKHAGPAAGPIAKTKKAPSSPKTKSAATKSATAPGTKAAAKPKSADKAATPKAPKVAKPKAPKYEKFDDSVHKETISAHKTIETIHRNRSLKIAAQQKAIREQAKALPASDKKGRADLKAQHAELAKTRAEHRAKAAEARTARVAESKTMQEARRQHVASHVAAKQSQADSKATPVAAAGKQAAAKPVQQETPAKPVPAAKPSEPAKAAEPTDKPTPSKQFDQPVIKASPMTSEQLWDARDHLLTVATEKEMAAAEIYSSNTYTQINSLLRTGHSGHPSYGPDKKDNEVQFAIQHLDSLMLKARVEAPVITYRVTEEHHSFAGLKPGESFVDKAFMSTTTDVKALAASGFEEGGYLFHITSPRGTKLAGIPSEYPEEREMLLARGSALRLDRREVIDGKHHMHFTVVGQE